jgi:hypothetical protein
VPKRSSCRSYQVLAHVPCSLDDQASQIQRGIARRTLPHHSNHTSAPPVRHLHTPAMSLDPPAYISSLQSNIRARPISWEGAVRAKTITEDDLKKIKAIDKVRKEQRKQTIEGDVKTYTQLLLGGDDVKSIFESAAKRTDILQYMLVLAGDLVDGTPFYRTQCRGTRLTLLRHPRTHTVACQAS